MNKFIELGVKRAQRIANQQNNLKVGDTVAHPDESIVCILLEIKGDMAVIGFKNIKHEVPINELFDPNIAKVEAIKAMAEAQ